MIGNKGVVSLGLLALAACVSNAAVKVAPEGKSVAVRESIDYPELGAVTEAKPGQKLLRQGTYTEFDGIELAQPNRIDSYQLSAGFYPKIGEDANYTYHSFRMNPSPDGYGHIPPARSAFGDILKSPSAIRAAKGKQETCVLVRDLMRSACDTDHAYKRVTYTRLTQADLQQELIYEGREGDRIFIGYREESGHYARPAYHAQAEYDLGRTSEITYKGARIRILDANGDAIRYQVLTKLKGW